MSNKEIKQDYSNLKLQAIQWCIAWREFHLQEMEAALQKDHTRIANIEFASAGNADAAANWLQNASRKQFTRWVNVYESTGYAIVEAD